MRSHVQEGKRGGLPRFLIAGRGGKKREHFRTRKDRKTVGEKSTGEGGKRKGHEPLNLYYSVPREKKGKKKHGLATIIVLLSERSWS